MHVPGHEEVSAMSQHVRAYHKLVRRTNEWRPLRSLYTGEKETCIVTKALGFFPGMYKCLGLPTGS